MSELVKLSVAQCAELLNSGKISSAELCEAFIQQVKSADPVIQAFLALDEAHVRKAAAESDKRRANGAALGKFDGIPVGIKDCISVKDERCSCASKILENFKAVYDATVIAKLRNAGFIPFGRTNMDEFAMGSSCENSAFQKTRNPRNTDCVPGGSSGGSAAAVAADEVPAALASDTGGSIRQPSAFCGVVGLKPTYGRVSRFGLVAFASSLDQIGPVTKTVEDSAIMLDTIGGHDPKDSTCLEAPCGGFAEGLKNASLKGLKIGLPKEYYELEGMTDSVKKTAQETIDAFRKAGAELVDVGLPHTKYSMACYYIVATAEASANLARFDGVRYGFRAPDARDVLENYMKTRGEAFGNEVKRRIMLGTYVLSSGYYDAYYLRAQKVRTLIRRDFEEAYKKCDILLTPVTPAPAFKFGEKSDPLQMYLSDVFTTSLNLSGNCGISIPAGKDDATGLPIGMQLMAPALAEQLLFNTAYAFERR